MGRNFKHSEGGPGSMREYVDNYIKKGRPMDPETKNTIHSDQWDREDYNSILSEMEELSNAEGELYKHVETGSDAMEDMYFGLVKAMPEIKDPKDIRPTYLINRAVMDEALTLKEYDELRLYSVGDDVSAGLSCVTMEPELETIFDKLAKQQEKAQELEQMMMQMEGMAGESGDADAMMQEMLANGDEKGAQNYQDQKARIQEQMDKLAKEMQKLADQIDAGIEDAKPEVREEMRQAMNNASDQADNLDTLDNAWGMDQGGLSRLPAHKRIELARKLNNDKFRRIAQLFGPMSRIAMAEQQRKVNTARQEIYDIELGNNLPTVLPIEMIGMEDEMGALLFFKNYIEMGLMQYKMRGTEKVAKGGIIFCEDGSGSMGGDREVWAKAVGLSLMQVAKLQNRDFMGIHFGGPAEFKTFEYTHGKDEVIAKYKATTETFDFMNGAIEYAETFFGGGTDFVTPLTVALEKLQKQHDEDGAVKGDIVFCTDGMCGVPDEWLANFKETQEELDFKVYGIIVGGSTNSEPLKTICDNRVCSIQDIASGEDVREIFRGV